MILQDIGDKVRLKIHFALNGVGTDPTAVALSIQAPDNTTSAPSPSSLGSGDFYYDLSLTLAGIYKFKWTGTGTVQQVEEGQIVVRPSSLVAQPPATIPVSSIIESAFRIIGVMPAPGRTASNEQMKEGLDVINGMIDADKVNGFMSFATSRTVFPLVVNQQDYSIGVSGTPDFSVSQRPPRIDYAGLILAGSTYEIPIELTESADRWRQVVAKTQTGFPWLVWYEKTQPNGTLHFWLIPSALYSVALYLPENIDRAVTVTSTLNLPPGFQQCYEHNLAVLLYPRYRNRGAVLSPETKAEARSSKLAIMSANSQPLLRESAFAGRRFGRTNINTGGGITW